MADARYDAVVVGAGPAGSAAALVLARAGASVALVDRASFPRDKACGDLLGPWGIRTLAQLGLAVEGRVVADMVVRGPSGRKIRLPASSGRDYPDHGLVVPRRRFDAVLRDAAIAAGAQPVVGRARDPIIGPEGEMAGFVIEDDHGRLRSLEAAVVVGADGAASRVAEVSGLVDPARCLWAFAIRAYAPSVRVVLPEIHLTESAPFRGYPGYGWCFPGEHGGANVGIGVGARGDRRVGARATRDLPAFARSVVGGAPLEARLGGWLKLGLVGTQPAAGRTLLVGDAAGLVNPLQGEGIAQALESGRAAAEAICAFGPGGAAAAYRRAIALRYDDFLKIATPLSTVVLERPQLAALVSRFATLPGVRPMVGSAWALFWNDLAEGARDGWPATSVGALSAAARFVSRRLVAQGWAEAPSAMDRFERPGVE